MKLTLFEFAIILHPKKSDNKENTEKSILVVPPSTYLAKDQQAVALYAAKMIPSEYDDRLEDIEIVVKRW